MVKNTTDSSKKSAVIEIAEIAEEYLKYYHDSATETKHLTLGNQKNIKDLVFRMERFFEILTYEELYQKNQNKFENDLLSLEE